MHVVTVSIDLFLDRQGYCVVGNFIFFKKNGSRTFEGLTTRTVSSWLFSIISNNERLSIAQLYTMSASQDLNFKIVLYTQVTRNESSELGGRLV